MSFPGTPRVVTLAAGTPLARIYDGHFYPDGAAFRHYGPHLRGRWDHHPEGVPKTHEHHSVLYATLSLRCAVAEVFGDDRRVSPSPTQRLAILAPTRDLTLADTCGDAAIELGVPAGALRTRDRTLTQRIARELATETGADGVRYEGWQTGETCVCLWEKAHDAVELLDERGLHEPLVAIELAVLADELHYDYVGWPPAFS